MTPVSPRSESDLPFARKKMVNWFSPRELARAGVKAVLSKLFGAYADNREIQALRDDGHSPDGQGNTRATADYSHEKDLWFDYVADLGDGFDSTYTVASCIARESIRVDDRDLARGRFLVMGGDQVYPTATREEYDHRLHGPYRAALSWVDPESPPPDLFAVPGNHDWYDGLTSFTRLFCQKRWIGGWKTRQSRSYFALKLPHDWWLWGVDIQLDSDIDQAQIDYFKGLQLDKGAKIALCVAEPLWVTSQRKKLSDYDTLLYFRQQTMDNDFRVGLAGDLHAYVRYEHGDGRQRFISGGGGAYLYPTHRLPRSIHVPTEPPTGRPRDPGHSSTTSGLHSGRPTESFQIGNEERAVFPPDAASRRLARGSLRFVLEHPVFSALFAAMYLMLVWLLQSASKALQITDQDTFLEAAQSGLLPLFEGLGQFAFHAPLAVTAILILWGGLAAFADRQSPVGKAGLGLLHASLHTLAVVLLSVAIMQCGFAEHFNEATGWESIGFVLLFSLSMLGAGTVAAGSIWGLYLYGTHVVLKDTHSNDVLSCQGLTDYKHFLRFHVEEDHLSIFALGIKTVPRGKAWEFRPGVEDGAPWFVASEGPNIQLIESVTVK